MGPVPSEQCRNNVRPHCLTAAAYGAARTPARVWWRRLLSRHQRHPYARSVVTTCEAIEGQVREHFPRPVKACEELLDLAADLLEPDEWKGRALDDSSLVDRIVVGEVARGLKTFRASFDDCLGGFGPQAAMLNRALFEGMAVAYWARAPR
jgi:hypothetical protein